MSGTQSSSSRLKRPWAAPLLGLCHLQDTQLTHSLGPASCHLLLSLVVVLGSWYLQYAGVFTVTEAMPSQIASSGLSLRTLTVPYERFQPYPLHPRISIAATISTMGHGPNFLVPGDLLALPFYYSLNENCPPHDQVFEQLVPQLEALFGKL